VLEIKSSVDLIPFLIGWQPIRHGQYKVRTKFTNCYKSVVLLLCLILSWTVLETGPWFVLLVETVGRHPFEIHHFLLW